MTYHHESDPHKIMQQYPHMTSVTEITEKDLQDIPKIKGMLDVALDQEFPLHDDGFAVFDSGLNTYWLNENNGNIEVQISMSGADARKHWNWIQENIPEHLMKYKDGYFSFSHWIA